MLEGMQRNMYSHSADPFHALRSSGAPAPAPVGPLASEAPSTTDSKQQEQEGPPVNFHDVTGLFSDGGDAGSPALPLAQLALKKITEISEKHEKEDKESKSEQETSLQAADLSSISDCCSSLSEAGITSEPTFKVLATWCCNS